MMENPFLDDITAFLAARAGLEPAAAARLVTTPPNPKMGDYAFPCFPLAKTLRKAPPAIAAELAGAFAPTPRVTEAAAAGPYVNFRVARDAYIGWVLDAVGGPDAYGGSNEGAGKTVIVDYFSPNIAKALGVHHLRTAMIGNSLCRLYRKLGYDVVGTNYLGDWGTGFGKLLAACSLWGCDADGADGLNALYVRFNAAAKKDASLDDLAREKFRRLEQGDPECRALWTRFKEISLREYQTVVDRLGLQFEVVSGESSVVGMFDEVVGMLGEKGLTSVSDDALVVDLSDDGMPPCLLKKGDDSSLYATRDLCTAIHRKRAYDFHRNVYVTDMGQSLHFRQVFRVLERAGFAWAKDCVHVPFGLMKFRGGKMAGRQGNIVSLGGLLDRAAAQVLAIIREKNPALADKERVAEQVGVGAVVFADLKAKRVKDVNFDWDEALNFEGETGPYLQYTHARLASVLAKAGRPVPDSASPAPLARDEEMAVVRALERYPRVLGRAVAEHEPSVVAGYVLELAAAFNAFYTQGSRDAARRILVDDDAVTGARLRLTACTAKVLRDGLGLLGMAAPEAM
jgi:arginyl-tRNA synthetase